MYLLVWRELLPELADTIELFANGISLGQQHRSQSTRITTFDVELKEGQHTNKQEPPQEQRMRQLLLPKPSLYQPYLGMAEVHNSRQTLSLVGPSLYRDISLRLIFPMQYRQQILVAQPNHGLMLVLQLEDPCTTTR